MTRTEDKSFIHNSASMASLSECPHRNNSLLQSLSCQSQLVFEDNYLKKKQS